jgi:hypothetical protein
MGNIQSITDLAYNTKSQSFEFETNLDLHETDNIGSLSDVLITRHEQSVDYCTHYMAKDRFVNTWRHFLLNKTNRRANFPNLFCQENLDISGSPSAHHQEFSDVHSALVYVMQVR